MVSPRGRTIVSQEEDRHRDDAEQQTSRGAARREALRKIGVYGAVAAPTLVAVLSADRAVAQSPIGPPITGVCTVQPPSCEFY
jgi:hypothetical protein